MTGCFHRVPESTAKKVFLEVQLLARKAFLISKNCYRVFPATRKTHAFPAIEVSLNVSEELAAEKLLE
jgi:hypothetical protein